MVTLGNENLRVGLGRWAKSIRGCCRSNHRFETIRWMSLLALIALPAGVSTAAEEVPATGDVHEGLFIEDVTDGAMNLRYPSASECKECHPDHYREWSVSSHAYTQISPVYNSLQAKIIQLTNGTLGDFCIRCHTPQGMEINEPLFTSNDARDPISREGDTCIVCHRVNKNYGKINGRISLVTGPLSGPIFGSNGNPEFEAKLLEEINGKFGEGKVHETTEPFFQITTSANCAVCHDITVPNGLRVDETFSEWKHSDAAKNGVSCQDCHMGVEQGRYTGDPETNYEQKEIAKIGPKWVGEKKRRTNHLFPGPDHSVVHPGIFPHNDDGRDMASADEWTQFDYAAGWGTDDFEDKSDGLIFPTRWNNIDERYEARELLDEQFELLEWYHAERQKLLETGYALGGIEVKKRGPHSGVTLRVPVENITDGHYVPAGLITDRVLYLELRVDNEAGETVYVSGDLDPNFDVRDLHSVYVHNGELPQDRALFSLQSRFMTRNLKGGEKENTLAANLSPSPLPFTRPSTFSTMMTMRPSGVRVHKKSIEPLGKRVARYTVKGKKLTGPGTYTVTARLIAGMVPGNLIHEIADVGFDYGLTPRAVSLAIRFGVGDVMDIETGERIPRAALLERAAKDDFEGLRTLYGVAGGYIVAAEQNVEFTVE